MHGYPPRSYGPRSILDQIEEDHPTSKQRVMYAMNEWLQRDTEASWKKVIIALREIKKTLLFFIIISHK